MQTEEEKEKEAREDLLVDHDDDGHDVLEGGSERIEMRPQIILEILANLQNHDALQGNGFGTLLHQQFGLVDFANQLRVQLLLLPGRCIAARQPVRLRNLRQAVALNLGHSDGAGNGAAATTGHITYRFGVRRPGNRVLGDAVAAEIICPGAVNLGHDMIGEVVKLGF